MTIESPERYVTGSITSLCTALAAQSDGTQPDGDHAPPEVPERQSCNRSPVDDEHREATDCHPPSPSMGFRVTSPFERFHCVKLPFDCLESPSEETGAVGERRHFNLEAFLNFTIFHAKLEFGCSGDIANEIAHVGRLGPLKLSPFRSRRCIADSRRRRCHSGDDQAADM